MKFLPKYIFLFLSILVFSFSAKAQSGDYSALTIDKDLMKNAYEVVRVNQMNFVIESEKSAKLHVKYAVTLLNEESDQQVQVVSYDKHSKITKLSAKVYDALGHEVRKVKGKEFMDQSAISNGTIYSDSRVKFIELNHSQYPYTIEFEYSQSFKKIPFYPRGSLQSYDKSVEYFDYTVEVPEGQEIKYKARNCSIEPTIQNKEGKTVYSWKASALPALEYEPLSPYSDQILPAILIAPTTFQFENYKGDMSTWESFGTFMYEINKEQDKLSPEMTKKVQELIADATSDREKIEILYRYLQENMRYVSVQLGIGGWQAFDADYVEKNKYGDCKALSNFMKSMLNEAAIESYWTLIYRSDSDKREMADDLVSPGSANHMIINIPSENMWLECTSNDYPLNYLGGDNQNRQALLITEKGGQVVQTPEYGLEENKEVNTANININEKGAAVIQKQSVYLGPKHDFFRYIKTNFPKEDIEKIFLQGIDLPSFTIDKLEIKDDKNKPQAIIDFHISVPRYSSKAGKRIFIPINKLNAFDNVPKLLEKRVYPVHVKEAYKEEDQYTFQTPDGFEVESIPSKAIQMETEFGKYEVNIEVKNQEIIYTRLLEIYAVELPAERYNELRDFYKEIAKADAMKVVLVKRKT